MNKVYKFDEFTNERIDLKTAIAVPVMAAGLAYGAYQYISNNDVANLKKTEIIGKETFKEYKLGAAGHLFGLTIDQNFMVSHHTFTESHGSGKHRHTTTTSVTNLIIPSETFAKTKYIWYKSKLFGGTYASPKPFPDSHLIKVSDLKLYKDEPTYTLYKLKGIFGGAFNYIIVNKDHKEGEEFVVSDNKITATYICDRINKYIYIIGVKELGGGKMGGAGAGGSF